MMKGTPEDARSAPLPGKVSRPALRALDEAGITTLGQLAALGEKGLMNLHGVGPKGVRILRQALQEAGLDFAGALREQVSGDNSASKRGEMGG